MSSPVAAASRRSPGVKSGYRVAQARAQASGYFHAVGMAHGRLVAGEWLCRDRAPLQPSRTPGLLKEYAEQRSH